MRFTPSPDHADGVLGSCGAGPSQRPKRPEPSVNVSLRDRRLHWPRFIQEKRFNVNSFNRAKPLKHKQTSYAAEAISRTLGPLAGAGFQSLCSQAEANDD